MSYVFSPEKVVESAAVILKETANCELNYMKFLKLLYSADRESIKETGTPITGDKPIAMRHGPVLSIIYNLLMERADKGSEVWGQFFEKDGLMLRLIDDPGEAELCQYEIDKLREVFERYKDKNPWELNVITHEFEEWKRNDPGQSSQSIPLEHIIDAVGRSDDMDDLLQARSDSQYFSELFDT